MSCWSAGSMHPDDIADDELRDVVATTQPFNGGSYIIDPLGEIIAGPAEGEEILIADASLDTVRAAKAMCDVGGHYSRPDLLRLAINRNPAKRFVEEETIVTTVVITGANRGLGLALARHYTAAGAHVIGSCRNPDQAADLRSTGAEIQHLDTSSDSSVDAFAATSR